MTVAWTARIPSLNTGSLLDLFGGLTAHFEEVDDDAYRPCEAHGCWIVHLCPGCRAWTVGYTIALHVSDLTAWDQAEEAASDHRRECPPLDMLAGLQGIPPSL